MALMVKVLLDGLTKIRDRYVAILPGQAHKGPICTLCGGEGDEHVGIYNCVIAAETLAQYHRMKEALERQIAELRAKEGEPKG